MHIYAVKALGNGRIEAYAVRWGSPAEPDRSREKDFFTPQTDLMLNAWGWPRPILYEHQADQVGEWYGARKDSVGVKLNGQLDTSHPRYAELDRDIRAGTYYLSSDSAPHLVKRRQQPNGTNELERWALLTASLTKTPAEHRLMPAVMVKALALKAGARHSAADAADMQQLHEIAVRQGAMCAAPAKAIARRPLRLSNPDLFYTTVANEAGFVYAARLKRRFDLEDTIHRIELEEQIAALEETPEARKARILAQIRTIEANERGI